MKCVKNENMVDRYLRVLLAEILFIAGFFWLFGIWQTIAYVLAVIMIFTAVSGFCALYALFGINTNKEQKILPKIATGAFIFLFIVIAISGSYASNFYTKKIFLEDYNRMNEYYKQTLFFTGQNKREEAVSNYEKLATAYPLFNKKYQKYHPYVLSHDTKLNTDLSKVSGIIVGLEDTIATGDLPSAHVKLEQVRPLFQDILKRNGFSMLAVSLVDFHDAMEKIIASADAKDPAGIIAVYPEVSEKLKAIEESANDAEIQTIRQKLEEILTLAKEEKADQLSAKAAELKSSFVKVYLKRG
jgi:hypothetical protein